MKTKYGVTGILFDVKGGKRYFLLLHRVLNWKGWEFVKGGIEKGEDAEQAVLREIKEEASLDKVSIVSVLPKKFSWASNGTKYIYTPFILRADMNAPVSVEQEIVEHDDFKWVEEETVAKMLTHGDNRRIFAEAILVLRDYNG
ncbi:MAG: NUDIX domain-containing protein [archaeon]